MKEDETMDWKSRLQGILDEHGCQTGTIHQAEPDGAHLVLLCQIGVPESLIDKISRIPIGKGIAGVAAERREPVTLCNLQQDLGGVAKPDARQTGVSGSLAVPVFSSQQTQVLGTLGIGKFVPHDFTEAEIKSLESHAAIIGRTFEAS